MQRGISMRLTSYSMLKTIGFNFLCYLGLWLSTQVLVIAGIEDIYSNSYVSPNSAENNNVLKLSESPVAVTSGPSEIYISESKIPVTSESEITLHLKTITRIKRSADPILSKPSGIDELLSSKNVAESLDYNDVELSGRIATLIQPSRTIRNYEQLHLLQTAVVKDEFNSGEAQGAPQGRSILLSEPQEINPTATTNPSSVTTFPEHGQPRQANPDIQDIITGIVKLLNGNVNVQANTAPALGRPLRPLSTRINNRGPPRINEVPVIPSEFELSPQLPLPPLGQMPPPISSPKVPTPYPFDIPPQNTSPVKPYVPLLEQLQNMRPGYHRPITIPPWNRPSSPLRRPINPYRRPKPPFKPIPISTPEIMTDKPQDQDILTLDLGSELQPAPESEEEDITTDETLNDAYENSTGAMEQVPLVTNNDDEEILQQEILNYEKNKEKSSSKMEKHTSKPSEILQTQNPILETIENTTDNTYYSIDDIKPSQVATEITPTTENSVIETDSDTIIYSSTSSLQNTPILEPSIQETSQIVKEQISTFTSSLHEIKPTPEFPISTSSIIENYKISNISSNENQTSSLDSESSTSHSFPYFPYRPRPGIVLDDTEYKPGGVKRPPVVTTKPLLGQIGDIFDITVSAIQGLSGDNSNNQGKPYVVPVDMEHLQTGDIITSPIGDEGFVSIDGKRTYLNLFGDPTKPPPIVASPVVTKTISKTATGFAVPHVEKEKQPENVNGVSGTKPTPRRPIYNRRPSQPPVRIDTCIVGDDSTCDTSQHEICKTEAGVSACHCSPGHARRKHRDPCRKIVSMLLSLRVDRLYERRVVWVNDLSDKGSESYQQLSYETERAMDSAMSMTPFSDEFLGVKINTIYKGERSAGQAGVFVNVTLQLEANADTSRPTVRGDIQRHLLGVIQRRSNNVGNSALWVDSPPGSVSNLQDLDECSSPELHDCHSFANCVNVFGGFKCECRDGFRDPWLDNKHRAGRSCEQCSAQHCNNRGECKYQNGQEVCICIGNYYGSQCEIDGEILGVAIGASVAAVIIIGLTLVCLVMWSRRWNREHKRGVTSPVFGYMASAGNTIKTPVVGGPPYQVSMEDRIRWAQIADAMAQSNHYGPEPVTSPTRPSSAMFGYPNLSLAGTLQRGAFHGTLPPVPLPRLGIQAQFAARAASIQGMKPLDNSSSSEEEDRTDLLGRSFQVPRPKSRSNASIANQSGIYYDVDYEQNDFYKQGSGIPMNTYTIGRPYYRS